MLVTQSIESNVNILANLPTAENILSILQGMPFDLYHCQDVTDTFMIPHFILFLDGHVLTEDNKDIDIWECYLTNWTGRMSKCPRCRKYNDCSAEDNIEEEDIDIRHDYKAPVILLHADKRQREVEGLVALIPQIPVVEPFSLELEDWLKSTCLGWQKKALRWRKEFEQWRAIEEQKYSCKPKTFSEIAARKWMPRKMTFEISGPEFESK